MTRLSQLVPIPTVVKTATFSILVFLAFACGRASAPPSSIAQSPSRLDESAATATAPLFDPAQSSFIVPPELAVMTITLSATAESFVDSTQLLQEKTTTLLQAVNTGTGCSAQIADYAQPIQAQGKYLLSGASRYTGRMLVNLEISLAEMTSIGDRIQRLDTCLSQIPEFLDDEGKPDEAIAMSLSTVLPTVRDVSVHREALLQQRFESLQGVTAAAQPPSQFQATQTICTSNGNVRIVSRQLSGIELDVDFTCDRVFEDGPQGNNGLAGEPTP